MQTHFTRPALLCYQNQTRILQKKKRKFQVNMPEEYRHKNPQQDIKKSNSTILEKHHDPLN